VTGDYLATGAGGEELLRARFDAGGNLFTIIPLVRGVCCNEAIDELALAKGDFKGQSPAGKIYTLYREMQGCQAGGAVKTLD